MATNTIQSIRDDVIALRRVWAANPDFKLKDLTHEQFDTEVSDFETAVATLDEKDSAMVPLRNDRDVRLDRMNNLNVRLRAGIKGYFGDNSDEYELAGGTRSLDRKLRARGAASTPTPAPVIDPAK